MNLEANLMPAVSPQAKANQKEYNRKASFRYYHTRRLVQAAKDEIDLKNAIIHSKSTSAPEYILIQLYDRLERAQAAIKNHTDALLGKPVRKYTRNTDLMFSPEIEALLLASKKPHLIDRARESAFEAQMAATAEANPKIAASIEETLREWDEELKKKEESEQ
jgi:hypothetical protein